MRVRLVTAIALLVTLSACFSSKPPAEAPSEAPSPETGIAPSIFPHKSDWKTPEQHGVYVKDTLDLDTTSCLGCHKEVEEPGGGAPTCRSCHAQFPHSEPGITLGTHGGYVLKNGKAACATKCHGTDFKGGLSGVACTQCHTYPHADGWSMPAVHGAGAKGDLKLTNKCNHCHGDDWSGGKSKVSCLSCHKGTYPHPAGWSSPEQHGANVQKNGTEKCATMCHGVQLDGGLSGVGCKTCHTLWPHPTSGWMVVHGQTARTVGITGCTGCHKNDATGGKTGITCTQCHASLPAHQDTDWAKMGHGKLVMQQPISLTDPKGCPLCHGATLEGGKPPALPSLKAVKGCKDCHASYPQLHKSAAGAPVWNIYDGHGKWVMDQIKPDKDGKFANVLNQIHTIISDCKLCHGEDLTGGSAGKSCTACHTNFPHNIDAAKTPWLSKHGAVAKAENPQATSCATANCHGKDAQGLPAGEKEVSKKRVKGCADCHLQMPHLPLAQWDHGKSVVVNGTVLLDVNKCSLCHGKDWKGKNDAPSCYASKCHDNYPKPHRRPDGNKDVQWKFFDKHGAAVTAVAQGGTLKDKGVAACGKCHGAGLTGGPAGISCYQCHPSFPHAAGPVQVNGVTYTFQNSAWKGFDKGHGQYLVVRAQQGGFTVAQQLQKECAKPCHGTDLLGGTTKVSCYACHTTYPHTATWSIPNEHGAAAKGNLKNNCTACHGSDWKGGISKIACTTCHTTYPHVQGWATFAQHGKFVQVSGNGTCATQCHGTDLKGGISGVACTQCHTTYPHTADWVKTYDPADTKTPGGAHGLVALKNGVAGCLTGCHGTDGSGGNSGKACTTCHNYPHKADWKLGSGAPEYPPHALAVLTTQNTATKNDDTFNPTAFDDCAKCHGPALDYLKDETYPFPGGDKTAITVDTGVSVKRCTACHVYPHQKVQYKYIWYEWKGMHSVPLFYWTYSPGFSAPIDTCGSAEGKAGCHTSGPTITVPGKELLKEIEGCNFCHK